MFGTAQELGTVVTIEKGTVKHWLKTGKSRGWGLDDFSETVARVNRGSALLDEQKPEWVSKVIPQKLDMSSAEMCIIGQTYGNYDSVGIPFGMEVVKEMTDAEEDEHNEKLSMLGVTHGFLSERCEDQRDVPYDVLDRVWVYMLTERHKRQGEPISLAMPNLN